MDERELISRIRNHSFYEEPYNTLNEVQTKRIIVEILDYVHDVLIDQCDTLEEAQEEIVNFSVCVGAE